MSGGGLESTTTSVSDATSASEAVAASAVGGGSSDVRVLMEGVLKKRGANLPVMRERFCVATRDGDSVLLRSYKDQRSFVRAPEKPTGAHALKCFGEWDGRGKFHRYDHAFLMETSDSKVFFCAAPTADAKRRWVDVMSDAATVSLNGSQSTAGEVADGRPSVAKRQSSRAPNADALAPSEHSLFEAESDEGSVHVTDSEQEPDDGLFRSSSGADSALLSGSERGGASKAEPADWGIFGGDADDGPTISKYDVVDRPVLLLDDELLNEPSGKSALASDAFLFEDVGPSRFGAVVVKNTADANSEDFADFVDEELAARLEREKSEKKLKQRAQKLESNRDLYAEMAAARLNSMRKDARHPTRKSPRELSFRPSQYVGDASEYNESEDGYSHMTESGYDRNSVAIVDVTQQEQILQHEPQDEEEERRREKERRREERRARREMQRQEEEEAVAAASTVTEYAHQELMVKPPRERSFRASQYAGDASEYNESEDGHSHMTESGYDRTSVAIVDVTQQEQILQHEQQDEEEERRREKERRREERRARRLQEEEAAAASAAAAEIADQEQIQIQNQQLQDEEEERRREKERRREERRARKERQRQEEEEAAAFAAAELARQHRDAMREREEEKLKKQEKKERRERRERAKLEKEKKARKAKEAELQAEVERLRFAQLQQKADDERKEKKKKRRDKEKYSSPTERIQRMEKEAEAHAAAADMSNALVLVETPPASTPAPVAPVSAPVSSAATSLTPAAAPSPPNSVPVGIPAPLPILTPHVQAATLTPDPPVPEATSAAAAAIPQAPLSQPAYPVMPQYIPGYPAPPHSLPLYAPPHPYGSYQYPPQPYYPAQFAGMGYGAMQSPYFPAPPSSIGYMTPPMMSVAYPGAYPENASFGATPPTSVGSTTREEEPTFIGPQLPSPKAQQQEAFTASRAASIGPPPPPIISAAPTSSSNSSSSSSSSGSNSNDAAGASRSTFPVLPDLPDLPDIADF